MKAWWWILWPEHDAPLESLSVTCTIRSNSMSNDHKLNRQYYYDFNFMPKVLARYNFSTVFACQINVQPCYFCNRRAATGWSQTVSKNFSTAWYLIRTTSNWPLKKLNKCRDSLQHFTSVKFFRFVYNAWHLCKMRGLCCISSLLQGSKYH